MTDNTPPTLARPSYDSLAVAEDLTAEVGKLRVLAEQIDAEAVRRRHSPAARHHLTWAAEQVRAWADEAHLILSTGDGLDRRSALDTALLRRAITWNFLHAWRGPLGAME